MMNALARGPKYPDVVPQVAVVLATFDTDALDRRAALFLRSANQSCKFCAASSAEAPHAFTEQVSVESVSCARRARITGSDVQNSKLAEYTLCWRQRPDSANFEFCTSEPFPPCPGQGRVSQPLPISFGRTMQHRPGLRLARSSADEGAEA